MEVANLRREVSNSLAKSLLNLRLTFVFYGHCSIYK